MRTTASRAPVRADVALEDLRGAARAGRSARRAAAGQAARWFAVDSAVRVAFQVAGLAAVLAGEGCSNDAGQVIVHIAVPADARLSPLDDRARGDAGRLALFNDRTGAAVGSSVQAALLAQDGRSAGTIPPGSYDLRLDIEGGNQLLGLARTRGVVVKSGQQNVVTFAARKPLLFYTGDQLSSEQSTPSTYARAGTVMAIDTTLPSASTLPDLALSGCDPRVTNQCPGVTAATDDGLHLLVALPGRIVVLATGLLYAYDDLGRVEATAELARPPGTLVPPQPLAMRLSPDGGMVAVVTDQGLSLAPLPSVMAGAAVPPVALLDADGAPVQNATAVAWRPDSSGLVVLAGTPWSDLNLCTDAHPASSIEVSRGGVASPARAAPDSATDLAFAAGVAGLDGQLLFAVPCGAGVVTADGTRVIEGKGIVRMLVAAGRVLAVPARLVNPTMLDGGGPSTASWLAQVLSTGGALAASFDVPVITIPYPTGADLTPEIPIDPTFNDRFVAYDLAATPDGRSLAIASRARYEADDTPYLIDHFTDKVTGAKSTKTCRLRVVRNVYRLNLIDLTSNLPLDDSRTASRGYDEKTPCAYQCETCQDDASPPQCSADPLADCQVRGADGLQKVPAADGFQPTGLSILFGTH